MGSSAERAQASRSLNFDDLQQPGTSDDQHAIAAATRSKAPLTDKTIEELETQLVPSDLFEFDDLVNTDAADTDPDYLNFLQETFYKPPPVINSSQDEEEGDKVAKGGDVNLGGSANVDVDNDPDWMFLQELETPDESEYTYAKNTKVPKRELDFLITDAIEAYDLDKDKKDRKRKERRERMVKEYEERELTTPTMEEAEEVRPSSPRAAVEAGARTDGDEAFVMSQEQGAMLSLQLKQHIQLLTQMTVLTGAFPSKN